MQLGNQCKWGDENMRAHHEVLPPCFWKGHIETHDNMHGANSCSDDDDGEWGFLQVKTLNCRYKDSSLNSLKA